MNPFEEAYQKLNIDQKKAVDTLEGPVLVLAGPGTGKTQVLGLRIANILKRTDASPGSILCLTFQDSSVLAMRQRLQRFIGNEAFKVQIHTFHSFCSEIIRSFPNEFDFSDNVEAIKDIDKLEIFREILMIEGLTALQQRNDILGNFKGIVSAISNLKKEFITPARLLISIAAFETSLTPVEKRLQSRKVAKMYDLHKFYVKYLEVMQEKNLIDFDDMIFKVTEGFSRNDELVKYFQEKYLYTLVDEFQDTNNAQLEVIKAVASFEGLTANVFAVGDDDQTIFRFQGANSSNFDKFLNFFPDTEIIILHTNYRSKQEIIDAATNTIENNAGRVSELDYFKKLGLDKKFVSADLKKNTSDNFVQVHEFEHSFHENYWIGEKIKELVEGGVKLNEIAIIARINRQITNITKFLDKFGIPYAIKKSESILDSKYIKNLIQIFEIIADPQLLKNDKVMWEVLSQDFLKINPFDVFTLVHDAKEQNSCIYDFVTKTHLPKYEQILGFLNKIIALQQYSINNSFLNTFTKTLGDISIISFLETLPESYAELNRISSLFQFCSTRLKFQKTYAITDFLREVKLMRERNINLSSDPIDINAENKINIMTAHSSKGLEFEHVFIYQGVENKWEKYRGANDSIVIPPIVETINAEDFVEGNLNSLNLSNEGKMDEKAIIENDERRLFYVAMTRAKNHLYITLSKRYFDSDTGEVDTAEKIKSQFIVESNTENTQFHSELIPEHNKIMQIILSPEPPVNIPDKNKEYLAKLVDKNVRMSASKLNKYNQCHYKFLLEEIYKIPTLKGLGAEIGTAIHTGIEKLTKSYTGKDGKGEFLTLDQTVKVAIDTFNTDLDKELIEKELGASIDVAYEEIKRGISAYHTYFLLNPDKPKDTEFTAVGVFEGIKISGRIDKISKANGTEENNFVITDYKTTSKAPTITEFLGFTKNADKAHLRQILFYRLLLENANDERSKKIADNLNGLKIEYIDTKEGQVKVFDLPKGGIYEFRQRANSKKTTEFDLENEYLLLKQDLKDTFLSIKDLSFDRTTDHTRCQFCYFKNHCNR